MTLKIIRSGEATDMIAEGAEEALRYSRQTIIGRVMAGAGRLWGRGPGTCLRQSSDDRWRKLVEEDWAERAVSLHRGRMLWNIRGGDIATTEPPASATEMTSKEVEDA